MAASKTTTAAKRAGAKTPQDRLPKAEAENGTLTCEFRGVTVTVKAEDLDDYDALTALSQGLPDQMLTILVPDQADRASLVDSVRVNGKAKMSDVVAMTGDLMVELGAGN